MVPQQVACDRFPSSHYMVDPSLSLQAVAICIYLLTIHFIHFSGPQVPSSWGLILIDFIHIWFANFHRVKWCCSVNINITSSGLERKKKEDISRYVILTVRFSVLLIICLGRCRELHHVDVNIAQPSLHANDYRYLLSRGIVAPLVPWHSSWTSLLRLFNTHLTSSPSNLLCLFNLAGRCSSFSLDALQWHPPTIPSQVRGEDNHPRRSPEDHTCIDTVRHASSTELCGGFCSFQDVRYRE